ncbi:MAG TPA: DUF1570 domain-containing protein [Tepidisphaeraceae bacterium]
MTQFVWRVAAFILVTALLAPALRAADVRQFNTRHYLVHTDLDAALCADLAQRLDAMYDEYDQRLSIFRGHGHIPRLEVYLFRTQQEYLTFTQGKMQNSGGMFLPSQNLLAAFLGDQGRDQLRRTLQHEAFHQFAYNAIAIQLPVWLNEGLAQFFEEGLWNGDGFLLGEVPPRRLRQLQLDVSTGRLLDFEALLHMRNDVWARRLAASRADGVTQYNQSWAMVHFLVMGKNAAGEYAYRSRLLEMLRLVHTGKSTDEAFSAAFGTNVEGFRKRFVEYATNLRATPEATLIENQGVLADLLIDFDRTGRRFDDIESFRRFVTRGRYRLHYSRGELSWDTDPDMNCYFRDLAGRPFAPDELYLAPRTGAPIPDIVCRCNDRLLLRTRFHDADNRSVDHELLIEPVRSSVSISQ